MGYVFRYPEQAHVFPLLDLDKRIEALEKHELTLPLLLRLWFELVGSVNLMGTHPKWSSSAYSTSDFSDETELWYTDPLVVEDG
jgi:hypothetical protein